MKEVIEVLNKVHDFLGILIRENLIKEAPYLDEEPMLKVSDLADDLWEVIHKKLPCNNAAKMREALENSNGLLEELALIGEWSESANEQIAENKTALAAPPRNCDVYTEAQLCKKVTEEIKSELGNIPQGILDIVDIVAKGMIRGLFDEAKGNDK